LGNTVIPPLFSFLKSLFKIQDTPQDTLSTLAISKPEVIPQYIEAQARLLESETKYFQRDISGIPSQIVIDIRAIIRPASVILSFIILFISMFTSINAYILLTCQGVIGNWIGTKIEFHK
jgi:energy-converting hydrogenase Eha subunit F